jgi:hypothetical protein
MVLPHSIKPGKCSSSSNVIRITLVLMSSATSLQDHMVDQHVMGDQLKGQQERRSATLLSGADHNTKANS